jgi:hypothetical protein
MTGPAPTVETVAAALWEAVTGADGTPLEKRTAWLALSDAEKSRWMAHAEVAIADWRKSQAKPPAAIVRAYLPRRRC